MPERIRKPQESTMKIRLFSQIGDKFGTVGAIVATMECAMCFPALASIGAAIGLGFLVQWEGLFITTLLPLFAWIALLSNGLGWFAHHQWHRSLIGIVSPAIVLFSRSPWFQYNWRSWTLYGGLLLMFVVAVWDLVSPAHRIYSQNGCEIPDSCKASTMVITVSIFLSRHAHPAASAASLLNHC